MRKEENKKRKDKEKGESITVRQMIKNVVYLIKYAARYDRSLIVKIMFLNVFLLSGLAFNDTFILKMIINGLTGKTEFSKIMVLLLISLVLVVLLEWAGQLLNEWAKAKLIPLSGRIQRDLAKKNSLKDLIFYDDPQNYDTYAVVSQRADELIEDAVTIVSKIIGGIVALFVAATMILTIDPILAIFPIAGFTSMPTFRRMEAPENYDISTSNLTGWRSASELRSQISRYIKLGGKSKAMRKSFARGASGWIRTNDHPIISRGLKPTELPRQIQDSHSF